MLNLLVLLTMALGLFLAPTGSVSALNDEPGSKDVEVIPPNARAGAHIVMVFQTTTPIPLTGELYVQFPPEYYDTEVLDQIDDLAGHPEWTQVTWMLPNPGADCYAADTIFAATGQDDYFPIPDPAVNPANPEDKEVTWPGTPSDCNGWTGLPDRVNTNATQAWIPHGQVRLSLDADTHNKGATSEVPSGSFIRIDFWGPSSENPGEADAGIMNPAADSYPHTVNFCFATDEEHVGDPDSDGMGITPDINGWQCEPEDIEVPFAVRLYRKYQIPTYSCGYSELQYVGGFTVIQDALDAADDIWLNTGDYTDEEMWNLFEACPTLDSLINQNGDPMTGDGQAAFLDAVLEGVPVGAVIVVDADADGDGVSDVYTETLYIDSPGLMLGSNPNEMSGVDMATILAGYGQEPEMGAGVFIHAGGVTLGEAAIQLMVGDPTEDADEDGVVHLAGFIIQDAGVLSIWDDPDWINGPSNGVAVNPNGPKCNDVTDVFAAGLQEYTVLSLGENFDYEGNTLVFTTTATGDYSFDISTVQDGDKLVNLTTGWNGHVVNRAACYSAGVCFELEAGEPGDPAANPPNIVEINDERFRDGDAVAIFGPSANHVCDEARVDIRGNDILGSLGDGIYVYSAAVWVDNNHVYENEGDGFHGANLACDGAVIVCDGIDRSENQLELSNNLFELNGMTLREDWVSEDAWGNECFLPEPGDTAGDYDDAGIRIDEVYWFNDGWEGMAEPLYIHDNDILDNNATGIWLGDLAAQCGVRILRNDIETNAVFGVSNFAGDHNQGGRDTVLVPATTDYYEPTLLGTGEVDVIFKYNDVVGNGLWGVKNWSIDYYTWGHLINEQGKEGGPMFNAKENYWNYCEGGAPPGSPLQESCAPGGPMAGPAPCAHDLDQRSEALGYGDAVDKGTFYNPWLAVNWEALLDVETQGMRAYGSDSLMLQPGWNTLAVPIAVDDNYDEVAEILTLGTFLDADVDGDGEEEELVERLFEFDNTMGWAQNPSLEALHGYYIKIDPDLAPMGTKFPVIYNVEMGSGQPSYDLLNNETNGGWNLIGSGFGIDKCWDTSTFEYNLNGCAGNGTCVVSYTIDAANDQGRYAVADWDVIGDGEAVKWAGEVIESVVWGDNFSNGASMVVNPGVPGQIEPAWARTVQDIYTSPGDDAAWMYTGESYWVFMREDGTLAGFEMTPLYLNYIPGPIPLW
jgi:hypothetical protein